MGDERNHALVGGLHRCATGSIRMRWAWVFYVGDTRVHLLGRPCVCYKRCPGKLLFPCMRLSGSMLRQRVRCSET